MITKEKAASIAKGLECDGKTIDDVIAHCQKSIAEAKAFGKRKGISIADRMANNWALGIFKQVLRDCEDFKAGNIC